MASSEVGALVAASGARAPRNARQSALSCDAMRMRVAPQPCVAHTPARADRPAARHLLHSRKSYFDTANSFVCLFGTALLAPWSLLGGEYNPRGAWCGARARGTGTNANTTDTICP